MRHRLFFILLLLSLYAVYISCTDLLNDSSKEGQWASSFSLDEARAYFEENAEDLQPLTLSTRAKTRNDGASAVELTPDWNCATVEHNSEVTLFLIPLRSISVPLVNATIFKDGKFEYKYHPESERRLLVARRSNGDMEMFVTTIIPEIENTDDDAREMLKDFRYLSGNSRFSGKVFLSELNGQLVKGFGYTDGRNNGTLTLAFNNTGDTEEESHNHDSEHEHEHEHLMSISFQESTVIMTRGVGGEYYNICNVCGGEAGMCNCTEEVACVKCGLPMSRCYCYEFNSCKNCGYRIDLCKCVSIVTCKYCGVKNGCKCVWCSECGERDTACICVCEECFFSIRNCICGWYEVEDEHNHYEGSETPDNNEEYNEDNIKLARDLFHNSELPDSVWKKLDDSLKKIQSICLGKELCRILSDSLKGQTLYIKNGNTKNCLFGPIDNATYDEHEIKFSTGQVLGITLGRNYESNNLLHELMHAHRFYTEESSITYNSSNLNGEIEAQYTQLVYKNAIKANITFPVDPQYAYRIEIAYLYVFIDEYGKLNNDVSEIELKNHITNILKEYKSSKTYSNEKYKYDSDRTALSNFENLRTITKNCQ